MATCKYCEAQIIWLVDPTGRYIPVEPESFGNDKYASRRNHIFSEAKHKRHACRTREYQRRKTTKQKTEQQPKITPAQIRTKDEAYNEIHLLPSAPVELVTAVLRALTLLYHPDKGGSHEKMVRLNQARAVLTKTR